VFHVAFLHYCTSIRCIVTSKDLLRPTEYSKNKVLSKWRQDSLAVFASILQLVVVDEWRNKKGESTTSSTRNAHFVLTPTNEEGITISPMNEVGITILISPTNEVGNAISPTNAVGIPYFTNEWGGNYHFPMIKWGITPIKNWVFSISIVHFMSLTFSFRLLHLCFTTLSHNNVLS
jgi:hypothetical protein